MKRFCPKRISSVQLKEEGLYLASGSLWNYKLSLWYIGLLTWQIQSMIKQHSVCLNLKKNITGKDILPWIPLGSFPSPWLKMHSSHPSVSGPVLYVSLPSWLPQSPEQIKNHLQQFLSNKSIAVCPPVHLPDLAPDSSPKLKSPWMVNIWNFDSGHRGSNEHD